MSEIPFKFKTKTRGHCTALHCTAQVNKFKYSTRDIKYVTCGFTIYSNSINAVTDHCLYLSPTRYSPGTFITGGHGETLSLSFISNSTVAVRGIYKKDLWHTLDSFVHAQFLY